MDMGYVVKAKYKGLNWASEIYFDAQNADDKYEECKGNKEFSEVKKFNAYIHYEEIKEFE